MTEATPKPMTQTIRVPAHLAERVKTKAKIERTSPEAVILFAIDRQLEPLPDEEKTNDNPKR